MKFHLDSYLMGMWEYFHDIRRGLWIVLKTACVLTPAVAVEFFYPQVFYWTAAGLCVVMMVGAMGAAARSGRNET